MIRKTERILRSGNNDSVQVLYDETNDHVKMARCYPTGYQRIVDMGYLYQISEGNVPNHKPLAKFGSNDDVGAAFETVWDGAVPYVWPTTATVASIVGGAQDLATTGTGAWTINVSGLDENYDEYNEDVTMTADTPALTIGKFIRVFRMKVLTAGTDETNNAAITASINGSSAAIITAGFGQTLMALWTVPAGYTLYLIAWYANTSVISKAAESRIRVRPFGGAWNTKRVIHINGSGQTYDWKLPLSITEKSDIEVQHKSTAGGGDCASGFDGWYET